MPVAVASAPKRTEQMFQALKRHILRERQKKKQEQEADAEVERQRKERELQQKQDVMTLGENREQITQLEGVLAQLRDEKHQLFLQLKKVLNEDDIRRRQQVVRQHEPSTEVMELYGGLYPGVSSMGSHLSQLVMPSSYAQPLPSDRSAVYKVPQTHTLLTPSSVKRPRSPTPPPQMTFHQNYSPKPPPQQRVTYQNVKHPLSENTLNNTINSPIVFPEPSGYSYFPGSGASSGGNAGSSAPQASYNVYQSSSSGQYTVPATSRNDQETGPKQHPLYISQQIARSSNISQGYIHGGSMDHGKVAYPEEKYYPVSGVRGSSQVPVQGGGIPIQQPAQGAKTGGITSGYPIRPPTSHLPPPQTSNTSHGVYSSGVPPSSRLVYSQAGLPPSRYMQREV
uniref:Uncharacterized protein n=2 Tax=Panstrongylus TaxID=65342 RepID=A0A069DT77_9HEMI